MLDNVQIILWSITYVLVLYFMLKNHKEKAMTFPLLPCLTNLSWETVALIASRGFWGHIIWILLDTGIFITLCVYLPKTKRKKFALSLIPFIITFVICFDQVDGMLISCFAIDVLMAICFWVDRKKICSDGKIMIAITKLFGDLAAALYYSPSSKFVFLCGVIVLIVNTCYLIYCVFEKVETTKNKKRYSYAENS